MTSTDATDDVRPPSGRSRPLKRVLLLLLWAPAAWMLFFWVVYLVAEVSCLDQPPGSSIGETALIAFVAVATAVALATIGGVLVWARSSESAAADDGALRLIVVLIVGCFVLAALAVGLPAAVLDPC